MNKTTRHTLLAGAAAVLLLAPAAARAAEFHVAPSGNDANPGTQAAPLRTIQRAADLAQPGDVDHRARGRLPRTHQPAARRRVRRETHRLPGRAGREGRDQRLGSRQELGEGPGRRLEGRRCPIRSSATSIPTATSSTATGSIPRAAQHHTGAVYLNGDWLTEAAKLDDVLKPVGSHPALVRPGGQGEHHDLGAVQGRQSQRATGGDQRAPDGLLSGQAGHELHHRARLHPAARGHALGAAHRRADRPDRHALEQGLDHREQRDQPLDLLRHRAGQIRRPVGQHVGQHRRGLRQDHRARPDERLEQGDHRPPRRPQQHHLPLRAGGHRRQPGRRLQRRHRQHHPRHPRPAAVHRRRDGGHQVPRRHRRRDQPQPHLPDLPRPLAGLDGPGHARLAATCSTTTPAEDLFVEVDHGPFLVDNNLFLSAGQPAGHVRGRRLRPQPDRRAGSSAGPNSAARRPTTRRTPPPSPAWSTSRAATTASTTTSSSARGRARRQAGRQSRRSAPPASGCGCTTPASSRCKPAATSTTTARGPTPRKPSRSSQAAFDPEGASSWKKAAARASPPDLGPGHARSRRPRS